MLIDFKQFKVNGIFLLKFPTEMLIRKMNGTLTHNGSQIYLGFLFNIYTKIKYEDERFKTHKKFQRSNRKLEYI
jgi:hypothetical protein